MSSANRIVVDKIGKCLSIYLDVFWTLQECKEVPVEECHTEEHSECHTVDKKVCTDVPKVGGSKERQLKRRRRRKVVSGVPILWGVTGLC